MDVTKISTDRCPRPDGWYSQAFGAGDLIFTAGITTDDPVTQELVGPGDIVKRTEQILENMGSLLWEAGSGLDHVIKTPISVLNIDDFEIFDEIYKKYFPHNPLARNTIQIGEFSHGMVIEIEAVTVAAD